MWYEANQIDGLDLLIAGAIQLVGLITILLISTAGGVNSLATKATAMLLVPLFVVVIAWFIRTHRIHG